MSSHQEEMAGLIIVTLIPKSPAIDKVIPQPLQYYLPIGETITVTILIFKTSTEPGMCI